MKAIQFSAFVGIAALALGLSSCGDTVTSLAEKQQSLVLKAADALTDCKDKDDIRDTADELYDIAAELMELSIEARLAEGDSIKEEANRTAKENKELREKLKDMIKTTAETWQDACKYINEDKELSASQYLQKAIRAVEHAF
ncbi:MAG: hypothetical protein E7033_06750 [Akkermansiaceae bacterium]|nr:hypothetical protein [Akkermansiaceae bacterium]